MPFLATIAAFKADAVTTSLVVLLPRSLFLFYGSFFHDFAAIHEATKPLRTAGSVVGASAEVNIEMQTRARSLADNPYEYDQGGADVEDVDIGGDDEVEREGLLNKA